MVTLQFPSIERLWKFRLEIRSDDFEMNLNDRTIICRCTDKDIELALDKYKGSVVEKMRT